MKQKFRLFLLYALALLMCSVAVSCSEDEPELPTPPEEETPATPTPGPEPEPTPDPPIDPESLTLLVYMVTDNSLGTYDFDRADLAEMQQAVDAGVVSEGKRMLIYYSRRGTNRGYYPVLMELRPNAPADTLVRYPDNPAVYSVSQERMKEVLADVESIAPAAHNGLILWSHASGWVNDRGTLAPKRSYGDDRGAKMSVTDLREALEGRRFDFIYFDCCHMATVEVAYELRHLTPLIVGSVTEVPADGMPYHLTLPHLLAGNALESAQTTFTHYDAMNGSDRSCCMSVIATAALDELAAATASLMEDAPTNGLTSYQRFERSTRTVANGNSIYTLFDFGQWVRTLVGASDAKLERWEAALREAIVWESHTPMMFSQLSIKYHCGLGCYIITDMDTAEAAGYTTLQWWRDAISHNPLYKK